jgi:hypothetical protein
VLSSTSYRLPGSAGFNAFNIRSVRFRFELLVMARSAGAALGQQTPMRSHETRCNET